ncbi:HIT-like protein [Artomyces pyxidatus]|uniref:HIT-like protein n=1 Tax=Artomyces pyxidatus TaxID=48021 RepID=A0ACB8SRX0_9AGAM|nr:HIT-like protein [Artomyces pyxidatus]
MAPLLSWLSSCFIGSHKGLSDIDTHHSSLKAADSCIFCHVSQRNGFDVVYEDSDYTAFKDHKPSAMYHFLVIPRRHVGTSTTLGCSCSAMTSFLASIGHTILDDLQVQPTMRRLRFHIPPFNSVDHLHLHVMGLPFRAWYIKGKYPWVKGRDGHDKGWTWFAEVGQTIRILEKDNMVGVGPC